MTDEELLTKAQTVLQEARYCEQVPEAWGTGDEATWRMVALDDVLDALNERLADPKEPTR